MIRGGFGAVYGVFPGARNPLRGYRDGLTTSEAGGAEPPQRRTRRSRTIMTEITIRSTVVMTLRRRGRAPAPFSGGVSGMALRHARHELCLSHPGCLRPGQRRASRRDHAPGATERALTQLQAEQPVALERPR